MSAEKRPADASFGSNQLVKRQKSDANLGDGGALVAHGSHGALAPGRTSSLQAAVTELSGHTGEVFAARFDPTGKLVASGSMDRSILLWRTHGACDNYGELKGHKQAVLDLQWSRDSRNLFSASADTTLASWDLETGQRVRRHEGHDEVINSVVVSKRGGEFMVTGSDDGFIGLWDSRVKRAVDFLPTSMPVTAVAVPEAGHEIYSGGIDNDIRVWDFRKRAVAYCLLGHADTVSSLEVSPDSQYLLSNSHDSTVRTWDIRPFAPADRSVRVYDGAPTGLERNLLRASWDVDGRRIVAGSGDGTAVVWETATGKMVHKLPGHKGAVNDVRFSPNGEPICTPTRHLVALDQPKKLTVAINAVLSASTDRTMLLGELAK